MALSVSSRFPVFPREPDANDRSGLCFPEEILLQQFLPLPDGLAPTRFNSVPARVTRILTELYHLCGLILCRLIPIGRAKRVGNHLADVLIVVVGSAGASPIWVGTEKRTESPRW